MMMDEALAAREPEFSFPTPGGGALLEGERPSCVCAPAARNSTHSKRPDYVYRHRERDASGLRVCGRFSLCARLHRKCRRLLEYSETHLHILLDQKVMNEPDDKYIMSSLG
jgi:hypothetical protein